MAQLPGNELHDGSLFEKKEEDMRDASSFWVRFGKMHVSAIDGSFLEGRKFTV
jgi:hypothetical protein